MSGKEGSSGQYVGQIPKSKINISKSHARPCWKNTIFPQYHLLDINWLDILRIIRNWKKGKIIRINSLIEIHSIEKYISISLKISLKIRYIKI